MRKEHNLIRARAPAPHGGIILARALNHHLDLRIAQPLIDGAADLVLHCHQALQTRVLHVVRHLRRHRCGRRARPLRVEERIRRIIAHLAQEIQRLCEVLLRLPGKAHDEIRRQARPRQSLAHAPCALTVLLHRIDAVHRLQDTVAPVLHGQMDVLTDMRTIFDRVDQLVADVLRMRRHKAHAANPLHRIHHVQEIGKIRLPMIFPIGVDILPEEGHLAIAVRRCTAHLRHDLLGHAAALTSAHVGDDAVRTVIIAPIHDRHPRRECPAARDGQILLHRVRIERNIHHGRTLRRDLRDNASQLLHLARTEHKVNVRCAAHEVFPLLLRHAARNPEDQLRMTLLDLLDLADLPVDLVLCRLAHTARIDEDDIGIRRLLRPHIARRLQLPLHALRIGDIHLTAID